MKKINFISAGIILLTVLANSAKADNISQLVVEKLVNADRKTGFILTSELDPLRNMQMRHETVYTSKPKIIGASLLKEGSKTYSIVTDRDTFDSIVSVKDSAGNEIKRISVGRQALKIIKANNTKHLFVLTGGYFGAVWEIDPKSNQVVKKYSTSWNPTDISLDSNEKFLYVTSGKLQKFSIENDITLEIETPKDIRYFNSISLSDNSEMNLGVINKFGNQANYSLNNSVLKLSSTIPQAVYVPHKEQTIISDSSSLAGSYDIVMLYSKNNDYLYLFSLSQGKTVGIIPVDARIDDVMILPKLNKALVLHRNIGQISLIDLKPNTDTQYSVFARIIDERLKDSSNTMVYEGNKVFIKSDNSQEGYIDTDNLLRYTASIMEIPLNKEKEVIKVSMLAGKRYYLKNSQLFYEDLNDPNVEQAPNRKIKLNFFGSNIGGLEINPNKKVAYISDSSKNMVFAIDTFTNKILAQYMTGSQPGELVIQNDNLYVLNRGDQTISTIDLRTGDTTKLSRLKVENNNLNLIKLYDRDFDQIIKITLAPDLDNKELTMVKGQIQE